MIEKIKNLKITRKRDWVIAFLFLTLMVCCIINLKAVYIDEWMGFHFAPDKLTYFNTPEGYGTLILTVLIVTPIAAAVLLWKTKKWKAPVLALLIGIAVSAGLLGLFRIQAQRIINTAYTTSPESVSVHYNGTRRSVGEKDTSELIKLCMALEPLSGEEQEEYREAAGRGYTGSDDITIWFPRVNGHSYLIHVQMTDEVIYICRAHGVNSYVFYSDNGLRDFVSAMPPVE
ncbi:MAG: hypothetical protein AB7D36_00585 [Oscillospiraceae bacterium]